VATIGLLNAGGLGARDLDAGRAGIHAGNPEAREVVSSGFRPLDQLLPAGGVRRGSLLEWLCADQSASLMGASGAAAVAFAVACRLAGPRDGDANAPSTIIVVDRRGWFHPPAVMGWLAAGSAGGSPGRQIVVARPARDDDEAWAIDQSLRCPGVAAVLAWPKSIHSTAMRRWQLAARSSGAVGLFVRPQSADRESTWAEARIAVSPLSSEMPAERRLRLALVGGPWEVVSADAVHREVEIGIDLARGREAEWKQRRDDRPPHRLQPEGVSCRAS